MIRHFFSTLAVMLVAFGPLAALAHAQPAPAPVAAPAAPLPDADPALWVVRDDDTTIYLFGTFHLLDGQRDWFNDEIRTAFDASNELVLEARLPDNPADLQPLFLRYAIDPEGRTLSSRLSEEQNRQLQEALTGMGVPPTAFDRFEPWFVSMTLASLAAQRLGITGEHGAETVLTRAARERGIEIGELEGVEFQLAMLDGMSEEMQLDQLGITLEKFDEIADLLRPMLAAWSEGDVDRLVDIMNEGIEEQPALYRLIFSERNATWAEWIEQRMARPGIVFVAVGAGHLAGRDSVQDYLVQRDLQAERVPAED